MKLETSHKLRLDGTVIVTGLDKKDYVFEPDADGMVSCEVEHKETVAHLLKLDGFFPADEADHEQAAALLEQTSDSDAEGDDGDDTDDKPANTNALPIESNTPPASIPKVNKTKAPTKTARARK
jgi:hypothetical protein